MQQIDWRNTTYARNIKRAARGAAPVRFAHRRGFRRSAWIAGALALAAPPIAAHGGSLTPDPAATASRAWAELAILTGFGVERASVAGHDMTDASDIFATLDLADLPSMASLDTEATRRRIERLPWIATARVHRVFPNTVAIRVTERRPMAVWRHGGADHLIDAGGRTLSAVKPGSIQDLPIVVGEGAPAEASGLLAAVAGYAGLQAHVARAERVARRRWTLHLDNGSVAHLPEGGESGALDALSRSGWLEALLSQPGLVVDLRVPGRVATRFATGDRT